MASNTERSCNGCGRLRVGRLPLSSSRSAEGALEHLLEASLHQEANPQKFLDALELLSVVQQVDFADRSYRQVFTENYRVLFQKSRHLYRLELWEVASTLSMATRASRPHMFGAAIRAC
ncbi:p65 [Symbiodinium microadriaticum]|nr:p65 [Symbiodinium microadriaticum]